MNPFRYVDPGTPPWYVCGQCGTGHCKLWRRYQEAVVELTCRTCTGVRENGKEISPKGSSWGWSIAAVPMENGLAYHGYGSVPDNGCNWWYNLPG